MSLIVTTFVPTGLVISGDSRTTGTTTQQVANPTDPKQQISVQTNVVLSDAAEKIFLIREKYGVGTYGDAIVNNLPIAHYIQNFTSRIEEKFPKTTQSLAIGLKDFLRKLNPIPKVFFIVVGYDDNDPWALVCDVNEDSVRRINFDKEKNEITFGVYSGGDTAVVGRLISQQQFNPAFNVMNLQDAIDYSRHLIRSTIDQLRFEPRFPTVGGSIDTLIVTGKEGKFLIKKSLQAK